MSGESEEFSSKGFEFNTDRVRVSVGDSCSFRSRCVFC